MISLIVAMDEHNLIGNGNQLPWYKPEDLKYFKKITLGTAVLMGYNTYLSIVSRLSHPLPNRINYVLTYEKSLPLGGIIVEDLEALLSEYENNNSKELIIIGGKSVYESLVNRVERLYLTRIHEVFEGDVFLNIPLEEFELLGKTKGNGLTFEIYERI